MQVSKDKIEGLQHDSSVSISAYTAVVQLTTSLSCLVFIKDRIPLDQSQEFSLVFGVERTYMISHVSSSS